jgi:hypothetical protein
MLAKEGKVIADDATKVRFSLRDVAEAIGHPHCQDL